MPPPRARTVLVAADRGVAEELALVFEATGIPHRLEAAPGGWRVDVAEADTPRAEALFAAWERERGAARPATTAESGAGGAWAGVAVAVGLVAFHAWTAARPAWRAAGVASADAILDGAWWRAVTALTLHSGPGHVLANAVAAAVLVTGVGRALGAGVGAWAVLLAGGAGNLTNAALRGAGHASLGASTAVFGALGVLTGLQLVRGRARAWRTAAASLALLGLLGTAPGTDLPAHALGWLAGVPLGTSCAFLRAPGAAAQALLALAALAAVVWCWSAALLRR
jgi:membrane associated rhomboid family serine protease